MLTKEENDYLTKTGPGTPMGNLIRQYWIPALLSSEVPEADCPPVRIRLLSEDLVAFRSTAGKVGLLQAGCPHRSADLFFGRNEEEGIRCTYHGWKFDTAGTCVDMPSEPPESTFKERVQAVAYPCVEVNGAVWTYMGPRSVPPPFPEFESVTREGASLGRLGMLDCNWLQSIENNMDTAHLAFMHYGSIPPEAGDDAQWAQELEAATPEFLKYALRQRDPRFEVKDTEFGLSYTGYRDAEPETSYHRVMHYFMPIYTMTPSIKMGSGCSTAAIVPVDDTHCMEWGFSYREGGPNAKPVDYRAPRSDDPNLPNTSDPLGRFRYAIGPKNDFELDREVQRTDRRTVRGYTGMKQISVQDRALTLSQGTNVDRTTEHLGLSDVVIIRARELLTKAARALEEHGTTPPGVDKPELCVQRSGWLMLPKSADFWEGSQHLREAYARQKQAEMAAPMPTVS